MERKTVEYQLGEYVGEYIYFKYLPTLSTDMLLTRNVITVSEEDTNAHNILNEKWYKSKSKEDWDNLQEHYKFLKEKYLPKELVCSIPKIDVNNMDELLDGMIMSLWDCDICHYSLNRSDVIIENTYDWFTEIKFKLD
jgi:hypothetical protein